MKDITIGEVQLVMQNLLKEGVAVRDLKTILETIDKLTTEKNLIISSSLITELGKAQKLINNKKTEHEVELWQKRFDILEKEDLPSLTDEIMEVEGYCAEKDYLSAFKKIASLEKNIYHIKAKSMRLLNEIKDLTESEERNREAITNSKIFCVASDLFNPIKNSTNANTLIKTPTQPATLEYACRSRNSYMSDTLSSIFILTFLSIHKSAFLILYKYYSRYL